MKAVFCLAVVSAMAVMGVMSERCTHATVDTVCDHTTCTGDGYNVTCQSHWCTCSGGPTSHGCQTDADCSQAHHCPHHNHFTCNLIHGHHRCRCHQ